MRENCIHVLLISIFLFSSTCVESFKAPNSYPKTSILSKASLHKNRYPPKHVPALQAHNKVIETLISKKSPRHVVATVVSLVGGASLAAVGGGALAGGLHAVSGPDHLAALLPRCIGQRWWFSSRIGAIWGLGHGLSGMALGMVAYFLKDRLSGGPLVAKLSAWTEILVGVSLVLIGALGLKEAMAMGDDGEEGHGDDLKKGGAKRVFFNGMLHGLSWDGTPSLAPALAFSSWRTVMVFLLAYCSGVVVAMSSCTGLIGEGSVRASEASGKNSLPRQLSKLSSWIAIAIGVVWTAKGFM